MSTNATATDERKNQLWGIYYTDREYAREMGDPLRTVIQAPTKLAAEQAAMRLGFCDPWAHPVEEQQIENAQWLPRKRQTRHHQTVEHKASRGMHV
jgi:hypothetical protein